jgi:hypothetical protein
MDHDWELPLLEIEKTSYTVSEFVEWYDDARLDLSPEFQRGEVWRRQAQAFLIDTILRGYPIPPIHIRNVRKPGDTRLAREVIDGQQRLTAVIKYVQNEYALTRPRTDRDELTPWAGLKFRELPIDLQRRILDYSFRCEAYKGQIPDTTVYEIFARINIHSVPLSEQELRNGRFFGEFKVSVYELAKEHLPFWRDAKIFSPQAVTRMLDAQFISEVYALQMDGMQDKKASLDSYYRRFDASWPERYEHESKFRAVIDAIRGSVGDVLKDTRFNRTALFYTLYSVVYHRLFALNQTRMPENEPNLPVSPREPLSVDASSRLRISVQNLSDYLAESDLDGPEGGPLSEFAVGAARQTDNIRPRLARFRALWQLADLSER